MGFGLGSLLLRPFAGIWGWTRKIPHISELAGVGHCCLMCKIHSHKKFDLVISAHEAENLPRGAKTYLHVECGRHEAATQEARVDDKTQKVEIHERLSIHVRQVDEVVRFTLKKKLPLSAEDVGELELNVVRDLIAEDFPTNRWYTLKKDGKNTCKLCLSFHKLDEGVGEEMSPLMLQAVIQAQADAAAAGKPPPRVDFADMEPKPRLQLLAKALEGPLKMAKGMAVKSWTPYYFKMVEARPDSWEWRYWNDKRACQNGEKKVGKFRMLGVANVLPDSHNRHLFFIKYHDHDGEHDCLFQRVDRDRDVWSEGLYDFIERLRDYLEKYHPAVRKGDAFANKKLQEESAGAASSVAGATGAASAAGSPTVAGGTVAGGAVDGGAVAGGNGVAAAVAVGGAAVGGEVVVRRSVVVDPNVRRVTVAAAAKKRLGADAYRPALASEMYETDDDDSDDEMNVGRHEGGTGGSTAAAAAR